MLENTDVIQSVLMPLMGPRLCVREQGAASFKFWENGYGGGRLGKGDPLGVCGRSPVRTRCGGGLGHGSLLQGGGKRKDLGNPQESRLVLDWTQLRKKSRQSHKNMATRFLAWMIVGACDRKEEETWEKQGWVPFDHVKLEGLMSFLVEKFSKHLKSK